MPRQSLAAAQGRGGPNGAGILLLLLICGEMIFYHLKFPSYHQLHREKEGRVGWTGEGVKNVAFLLGNLVRDKSVARWKRPPPSSPSFPPLILQVFGMPVAPNRVTGRIGTGPASSP